MKPEQWGPPIWTLIHTLTVKLKEEDFDRVGPELISYIKRIVSYLPCPECSQHASFFFKNINPNILKTKTGLKNLMYTRHNEVNIRTKKPVVNIQILEQYENKNIISVFNRFLEVYQTRGNMNQIMQSFYRNQIIGDFKRWIMLNIHSFE